MKEKTILYTQRFLSYYIFLANKEIDAAADVIVAVWRRELRDNSSADAWMSTSRAAPIEFSIVEHIKGGKQSMLNNLLLSFKKINQLLLKSTINYTYQASVVQGRLQMRTRLNTSTSPTLSGYNVMLRLRGAKWNTVQHIWKGKNQLKFKIHIKSFFFKKICIMTQ